MKFRDSIAYSKDLITGKGETLVKKKPLDTPIRGFVKVELFDAKTNKKLVEANSENILTNKLSRLAFMDYFYTMIKAGRLFKYIYITDSTSPEDPEVKRILGNIIGFADRDTTYSGTSTLQGTINLTETKLDVNGDGLLHFVFDFPTHACNGTFQSIFWFETNNFYSMTFNNYVTDTEYFTSGVACQDNDFFYYNNINLKSIKKYNKDSYLKDTDIDFSSITEIDGIQSISIYNDIYYIVPSTKNKLIKIDRSITKLGEIALTLPSGMAYTDLYSITMLPSGIYAVGKNKVLVKWNQDGTISKIATTALNMSQYYRSGALNFTEITEGIILAGASGAPYSWSGMIDKNTLDEKYSGRNVFFSMNNSNNPYNWLTLYDDNRNMYFVHGSDSGGNKGFRSFAVPMPVAQTLLAAPVTKTPTNTMKIQYDFQVQKVY